MNKKEMKHFWDTYSEVPAGDVHPFRKKFIALQNAEMRNAFDQREEHPLPYLHMSYRFRYGRMLKLDYEKAVGIAGAAVTNIETPDQNVLFPTLHAISQYWKRDADGKKGALHECLHEGRDRFIGEIAARERLQVYGVLTELMLEDPDGQEGFFERSGMKKMEYDHRRNRDRFMPFGFLADRLREYRGTNGVPPNPNAWNDEVMQRVVAAYVHDMRDVRRVPEPVAHLEAAFGFAGVEFTEANLWRLGVSRTVVNAIVEEKKLIPVDAIAELTEHVRSAIGAEGVDALLQKWSESTRGLSRRKTFYGTLQGLMHQDNVKPVDLLEACGVPTESADAGGVLRSALRRGPNKTVPPAAMLGALAHDQIMFEKEGRGMIGEFKERWMRSVRHCPAVRARLQYWGLHPSAVFTPEELPEYTALVRGEPSAFSERSVIARIDAAGTKKTLLPSLKRRIQMQTPTDLASCLRILSEQKGGVAGMTRKAGIHMEAIEPLRHGKPVIPAFVRDIFAASNVELPPQALAELTFRYAERDEAEQFAPVGRALDSLIARTKRYPNHVVNDLNLPLESRPSHLVQLQSRGADPAIVDRIVTALNLQDDAVLLSFLRILGSSESVQEALLLWYERMEEEGRVDVLEDFHHLLAMNERMKTNEAKDVPDDADSEEDVTTAAAPVVLTDEQEVTPEALFTKKAALRSWKRGEPFERSQLWSHEDERAVVMLHRLPGITRSDLAFCNDIMADFKEQREKQKKNEKVKRIKDFIMVCTWGVPEVEQETDESDSEKSDDAGDDDEDMRDAFDDEYGDDEKTPDPSKKTAKKKKAPPQFRNMPAFHEIPLPEGVTQEELFAFLSAGATAKPGSPMKVAIMAMRSELGISVNLPQDSTDHGDDDAVGLDD